MARGQGVTGWWAVFPGNPQEPLKFSTEQDAVEYWPALKVDSCYPHRKIVFQVWWSWNHPELDDTAKSDVHRTGVLADLTNPLSFEAFEEERMLLKKAALTKKKANKKGGLTDENQATLDRLDAITAKSARAKGQRQAYARSAR